MPNKIAPIPSPQNEPILGYLPNSNERKALKAELGKRKAMVYDRDFVRIQHFRLSLQFLQ